MLRNVDVVTLMPEMFSSLSAGVLGRFIANKSLAINYWNPRDYTDSSSYAVDDRPYGGGPGMVIRAAPIAATLAAIKQKKSLGHVVCLSPIGEPLSDKVARKLSGFESLVLLCGRYEGFDQRVCDMHVDSYVSIGDYVLSGGELPAMVLLDVLARFLPGCLGNAASADSDSFSAGLLGYPQYTRPACYNGVAVPEDLLSGSHVKIAQWRRQQQLGLTWLRRPDLLAENLDCNDKKLLLEYVAKYLTNSEEKL